MSDRDSSKLEFAIFCIENVAEALGILGNIAYRKLAIAREPVVKFDEAYRERHRLADPLFAHYIRGKITTIFGQ